MSDASRPFANTDNTVNTNTNTNKKTKRNCKLMIFTFGLNDPPQLNSKSDTIEEGRGKPDDDNDDNYEGDVDTDDDGDDDDDDDERKMKEEANPMMIDVERSEQQQQESKKAIFFKIFVLNLFWSLFVFHDHNFSRSSQKLYTSSFTHCNGSDSLNLDGCHQL